MSSVIVAKASVILAFKFVISGTGVENTLSLTYRHKKEVKGVISGDRGGQNSDHLSQSTRLEMLHPKTDEHVKLSVEVRHLVGTLSTAETLPTEVQRNFHVICVCNRGKTLCSPCTMFPHLPAPFNNYIIFFLQLSLSFLSSSINPFSPISPLIPSAQVNVDLPRFLIPGGLHFITSFGNLPSSIL